MDEKDYAGQLTKLIDDAILKFNGAIPAIQNRMLDDISNLVKKLETSDSGTIQNSVANLKAIGAIKNKLQDTILNNQYLDSVRGFIKAFDRWLALIPNTSARLKRSSRPRHY